MLSPASVPAEVALLTTNPDILQNSFTMYPDALLVDALMAQEQLQLAASEAVRKSVDDSRSKTIKAAIDAGIEENKKYVQELEQSQNDLVSLNSSVPAIVIQDSNSIVKDDVLVQDVATPFNILGTAADPTSELAKELAVAEEMGLNCGYGDTLDAETAAEVAAKFDAALDSAKLAADEQARLAIANIVTESWSDLNQGTLSSGKLLNIATVAEAGVMNAISTRLAVAAAGKPGINPCSSQTMTNASALLSGITQNVLTAAQYANALALYGTSVCNQVAEIYGNMGEFLADFASVSIANAANLAIYAARCMASNCTVALGINTVSGAIQDATLIGDAAFSVADTSTTMLRSVKHMVHTIKRTPNPLKTAEHLLTKHNYINKFSSVLQTNAVDLRQYQQLTTNGIKYARIALGASEQNKISAALAATNYAPTQASIAQTINRTPYSTSYSANRNNMFGLLPFAV